MVGETSRLRSSPPKKANEKRTLVLSPVGVEKVGLAAVLFSPLGAARGRAFFCFEKGH